LSPPEGPAAVPGGGLDAARAALVVDIQEAFRAAIGDFEELGAAIGVVLRRPAA
jgi:hypothetical protein